MKRIVFALATVALLAACNSNKSKYDAEGFFESTEITISAQASGLLLYYSEPDSGLSGLLEFPD